MEKNEKIWNLFNKKDIGPYNIEESTLLAVNLRGGYFLSKNKKSIVNVVFKNNGYGNCIMGSLFYMKRLMMWTTIMDYKFTEDGYRLLELDKIEKKDPTFKAELIYTIDDIKKEDKKRKLMDEELLKRVKKN